MSELQQEINLLKNLDHPNIVRYLGCAIEDNMLHILMEFMSSGSVAYMIKVSRLGLPGLPPVSFAWLWVASKACHSPAHLPSFPFCCHAP